MAGGFGMYARNYLAGQGRYIPDTEKKAPAAQAADGSSASPKHDACETCNGHGLIDTSSGQTPDTYQPDAMTCEDCDGTGKATPKHDEGREHVLIGALRSIRYLAEHGHQDRPLHVRLHMIADEASKALATQPAARRVTDEDARKAYAAFCTDKPFDAIRAMRAALESFAQSGAGSSSTSSDLAAEGVSE